MSTNKRLTPASNLLARSSHGVLSTIAEDLAGYPFGSLLPYCLDEQGYPIILISRLARHTRNIRVDHRVSLLVAESGVDNVHKAERMTLVGNAVSVPADSDAAHRYYRYFPHTLGFVEELDFEFYHLLPVSCYYVGGFGRITPYSPESVCENLSFGNDEERDIISHMNTDHVQALEQYCGMLKRPLKSGESVVMVGVDRLGCHLRIDDSLLRLPFRIRVDEPADVRQALIELLKEE